jgi:hypothetical protein
VIRKNSVDGMQVATRRAADGWQLDIRRHAPDGAPVNGIEWDAALLDENGNSTPVAAEEVGLGRYRANIKQTGSQRVTLRLRDTEHDKTTLLHFHEPYPAEYRLGQEVPEAIAALPVASDHTITDDITPTRRRRSTVHYAYFASLGCLLMSILFRRL